MRIMDHFSYRERVLHCEDVPLRKLAETYGTPLFVYSKATLLHHLKQLQEAFAEAEPLLCYSIKTNGNLGICRLMAEHGSGFDVTSAGELYRASKLAAKGKKSSSPASVRPMRNSRWRWRTASFSST